MTKTSRRDEQLASASDPTDGSVLPDPPSLHAPAEGRDLPDAELDRLVEVILATLASG